MTATLDGFTATDFTHGGTTRTVYRAGTGPGIVVMSEMPGITPAVAGFARRLVDDGFAVAMPHLFGEPGRAMSVGYTIRSIAPACVSREFTTWACRRTSPVTEWLRALARDLHDRCGGSGVGAIGMCFTGGFALGMAVDEQLRAPVLSQPSLPFPVGAQRKRDLGIGDEDLARLKERVRDDGLCVLGLRFTHDRAVPAERFQRLRDELGDAFIAVEIDSSSGNPHGNPRLAHSVVTEHLVDTPGHPTREALDRVIAFFHERLDA
jgi:dienelactone hydrolase